MSRFIIGSRAALIAALRAQEAPLAAAEAAAIAAAAADEAALRAAFDAQVAALRRVLDAEVTALGATAEAVAATLAARRAPIAERRREVAEELFLDALFLVAQFPGGQIAEADKCCYAYDVRLCAGLCRATWAEEAFWSGLVRVHSGRCKRTRLMYAAAHGDAARVAWLLARGAPREAKNVKGFTALVWASAYGNADALRVLLAAGASVNTASNHDVAPLYLAAQRGHDDVVRLLLSSGARVDAAAARLGNERPLHAASSSGHAAAQTLLLDARERPLHHARDNSGHLAAATLLLDAGADVNALDNGGTSPLTRAVMPAMRTLLVARGGVELW